MSIEDKIALGLFGRPLNGDVAAIWEMYDSFYGKLENNKEFVSQLRVTISAKQRNLFCINFLRINFYLIHEKLIHAFQSAFS